MGLSVSLGGAPDRRPTEPREDSNPHDGFEIRVEEQGSTLVLHLSGEFDWACIGSVEAALERVSETGVEGVILDLQELEFMDSAGLRTILRAHDRARLERFELVVVRPRGLANRVFTLTRASKQLTLVDGP